MRCNIKHKELPKRCPKCNKRLKSEKCDCGHIVSQKASNEEEAWYRRMNYGETFW